VTPENAFFILTNDGTNLLMENEKHDPALIKWWNWKNRTLKKI